MDKNHRGAILGAGRQVVGSVLSSICAFGSGEGVFANREVVFGVIHLDFGNLYECQAGFAGTLSGRFVDEFVRRRGGR